MSTILLKILTIVYIILGIVSLVEKKSNLAMYWAGVVIINLGLIGMSK